MYKILKIMLIIAVGFAALFSSFIILSIILNGASFTQIIYCTFLSLLNIVFLIYLIYIFDNKDKRNTINPILQQKIKELRITKALSPKVLAEILGIKESKYMRFENGKEVITIELLIELANYYNVSLDYIVGRTMEKTPIS